MTDVWIPQTGGLRQLRAERVFSGYCPSCGGETDRPRGVDCAACCARRANAPIIKLTPAQASLVGTYATEDVHVCESMILDGLKLMILDVDKALAELYDAANSADEDKVGSGKPILTVARKVRT